MAGVDRERGVNLLIVVPSWKFVVMLARSWKVLAVGVSHTEEGINEED